MISDDMNTFYLGQPGAKVFAWTNEMYQAYSSFFVELQYVQSVVYCFNGDPLRFEMDPESTQQVSGTRI